MRCAICARSSPEYLLVNNLKWPPNERKLYLDRSPEPGFSKHVACQFDLWHLRRRARYGRNVDDEPRERFTTLFVADVHGGFLAFFLFYPAGGRTRRHDRPQAHDVRDDDLAGHRGGGIGALRTPERD